MPRNPNEPDPIRWQVLSGNRIGLDITKRTAKGRIDKRNNNSTLIVAQMLINGKEGELLAKRIINARNKAESE